MIIFAISAWKGSGKDTAADHLIKSHDFKRIGFADPLKDTVAQQFSIPRTHLDDPNFKENALPNLPVTAKDKYSEMIVNFMFREFKNSNNQQIDSINVTPGGLVLGKRNSDDPSVSHLLFWTPRALCILEGSTKRSADSDYWVKQAVAKAAGDGMCVISDLRYRSELGALKDSLKPGDLLVPIRINRFASSPSTDPSERDLDNADFRFYIDNTGTKEELYSKLDFIVETVKQREG